MVHGHIPLGKTPVLQVGDTAIFESAVILEYLEETQASPLHPADPLRRRVRIGHTQRYCRILFRGGRDGVRAKDQGFAFARLEARLGAGPYFDGESFSLVDVVFSPIFRYFDALDWICDFGILAGKPKVAAYRQALSTRP